MRPMPQLEVVEIPTEQLLEYPNNAKEHPAEQVDQIASSISEFGFNSPILAWHNDQGEPEIVAGHGRLMAAKKLGLEELPVVFLDHMSDEQRRAYILVDNKLTMNSDFDFEILADELGSLDKFNMIEFGFSEIELGVEPDELDLLDYDKGECEVVIKITIENQLQNDIVIDAVKKVVEQYDVHMSVTKS